MERRVLSVQLRGEIARVLIIRDADTAISTWVDAMVECNVHEEVVSPIHDFNDI